MKYEALTDAVICCFYSVYNTLGSGFLEKVYENALLLELRKRGLDARGQVPIQVYYKGEVVGEYFADILINDILIVEIKAGKVLLAEHEAQLLNYLKATGKEVGLLINFGPTPELKRRVFTNRLSA